MFMGVLGSAVDHPGGLPVRRRRRGGEGEVEQEGGGQGQ